MLNITFFEKLNDFFGENGIFRISSFSDEIIIEFREALRCFAFRE